MHGETTDGDDILQAGGKPDVNRIIGLYKNAKNDLSDAAAYYRRMQDVRYCQWAGMSSDGRKHADKNGKVFPWDGASDLRTFVVDDIIESLAASAMRSLFKARITAIPRTGGDYEMAGIWFGKVRKADPNNFFAEYFYRLSDIRRKRQEGKLCGAEFIMDLLLEPMAKMSYSGQPREICRGFLLNALSETSSLLSALYDTIGAIYGKPEDADSARQEYITMMEECLS